MFIKKWVLALLVCSFLALGSIAGVSSYVLGNSQGYSNGHEIGYTQGYSKGRADGYSQGNTDGYSQGYNAEQANFQQWLNQSCFSYPFLLLDQSQYIACHR